MVQILQNLLERYRIVLASHSPRRKQLLEGLDIPFVIGSVPDFDETFPKDLPKEQIAQFLAVKKGKSFFEGCDNKNSVLVITADTVVLKGEKLLGKPKDEEEAKEMLRCLSGNTHRVITAVCLTTSNGQESFSTTSKVTFGVLSDYEIEYYVEKYRPYDKAGAYGIQEWIGYVAVKRIEGSFYNIMGLPVYQLYEKLCELNQILC